MKKRLLHLMLAVALIGIAGISNGQTILLSENFSSGSMPTGWSQDSAGVMPYWTWSFNDPGARYPGTLFGSNFDANFAIFDSDHDGTGNHEDAYLNTPVINASAVAHVYLIFDMQYRDYDPNDYHQVEVSIDGGTSWTGIQTDTATSFGYPSPAVHVTYDITSIAAGQASVKIRFHYVGIWGWWWAIDNVSVVDALPAPPANDDCANATTIIEGTTCVPTSFNLGSATNSGAAGCSGATPDDDVWFSFVATSTDVIVRLTSGGANHTVEIYDACGGTSIACLSPGASSIASLVSGLTSGNTYKVEVYTDAAGISDVSTIDLCLMTPPPPPANDDCSGAVSLTVNANCVTTAGTLDGATNSGVAGCQGTADDDVWYSFVANDTVVAITVSGHGINDPVIEVFDACGGTSLACINNFIGSNYEKGLARTLTIGTTYYFRVFSYGIGLLDSAGFDVCVTNVVFPANDDCSNAIVVTPVANENSCNLNTLVVTDLSTPSPEPISCSSSNYWDDVWYSFTATADTMTATTFNHSPGVILNGGVGFALYDGSCSGTQLFCYNPPTPNTRALFTGLVVGNTYLLRTFTASGLTAGSWNMCIFGGLFTKVNELNAAGGFQLYPDPTNGSLNVSFGLTSGKTIVKVYDMIGNLMTEQTIQNISKATMDLSSFANGIYFVKVENEKGLFTQKVILNK